MTELLLRLAHYPMMEILFVLAVVLVLVDYFFPVDWVAYVGYLCFGLGMIWAVPFGPVGSLVSAVVTWVLLLILHRVWFRHFLTNAPGRQRPS